MKIKKSFLSVLLIVCMLTQLFPNNTRLVVAETVQPTEGETQEVLGEVVENEETTPEEGATDEVPLENNEDTGITEADPENGSEEVKTEYLKSIPAGRFGRPEDVAEAAAFLADEASDYITGQVLCVDGGMAI